ncbi:hypothetical protein JCM8115_007134 [Rhodotorula mucilaginosa]|nr:hypothetical protein B0A53_04392 [Rhodotorula sp. CCFEE 5036]
MLAVCCSGFKRAVTLPAASLGSIAAASSSAASSHRRQPPQPRRPRPQASDRDADSYKLAEQVKQLVAAGSRRSSAASSPTASSTGDAYAPALNLIRSAPASAATVVVWNVLLNAVLVPGSDGSRGGGGQQQQHAAAVRRAYEIWMEMKRRGVVPTGRSYGTFLTGVAKRAKRAASELEHRSAGHHHSRALEGWNAELRAKVETVHKQWRMHCERVLERAERQGGPSSSSSSGEGGGQDDGRHDSIESLSPLPTNQYLSFLSASLTLSLATGSSGTAPAILDHLVRTFEAIPDPDVDPRLGRTTISYQVVLGAFKTVLQQAAGAVAPEEPVQTADTVEDGFKVLPPLDRPSQVGSETAVFPTAHQILERALAMWDHLVLHPPSPELPSPGSPSSSFSPSPAAPLPIILPTALLSLYLSTPSSSTATLPPATHARFLAIPQLAFGFVSPSRIADLEPPHPDELVVPLCGGGAPGGATLDRAAFGAALRTARRAAVAAGAESSTRWTRAWWDQVRDYPERFGLERGLGGPEEGEVGQVRLMDREAAQEVMKAAGRAGDVESIEELMAYLTTTSLANPALSYRSHAPLVSTYTLAISCLSRIGTQPALSAAIRLWTELVRTEPPFVPSEPRKKTRGQQEAEGAGEDKVAKAAYAKAAYEVVRMAVMGVRERTAVWAAVKAVAGGASAFGETTASGDHGNAESSSSRGAFHPAQFPPPPSSSPARPSSSSSRSGGLAAAAAIPSQREAEFQLVARILHNALGRIMSGDGRPGDLSAQLGKETVAVLEEWRERIKAFLSAGVDPLPARGRDSVQGREIPGRRRGNMEMEEPKRTTGMKDRPRQGLSEDSFSSASSTRPTRSSTSPSHSSSYPARRASSRGYEQRERSFEGQRSGSERWRGR